MGEAMKREGMVLYTITFQTSNENTRALFRNCATNPTNYFDSPSNEALRQAFKEIGTTLSNLRVAR